MNLHVVPKAIRTATYPRCEKAGAQLSKPLARKQFKGGRQKLCNKSRKTRELFFALRRELGRGFTNKEVLAATKALIDLHEDSWVPEPSYDLGGCDENENLQAVDIAMADGGWSVYFSEYDRLISAGDENFTARRRIFELSNLTEDFDPWEE